MSNEMIDDDEFDAFLRDATCTGELAPQTAAMLASLESARDAIQDVEWERVSRTFARMLEVAGADAPPQALAEIRLALRAIAVIREAESKLVALAYEQHGN